MVIVALYVTLIIYNLYRMVLTGKRSDTKKMSRETMFLIVMRLIIVVALVVLLVGQFQK